MERSGRVSNSVPREVPNRTFSAAARPAVSRRHNPVQLEKVNNLFRVSMMGRKLTARRTLSKAIFPAFPGDSSIAAGEGLL